MTEKINGLIISEKLDALEEEIQSALKSFTGAIYDPVRYIMSIGGKRIRPRLLMETAKAFGLKNPPVDPAVGIEIFHNFSLVHDDIMDAANLRRGQQTVHEKWDVNQAILSGDVMYGMAYDFISRVPERHLRGITTLFTKTTAEVCIGQQMDMDFETKSDVGFEEYLQMIKFKTSVLIGACASVGAMLADATETEQVLMYEYGLNLGMAFQIQDDYLDLYGSDRVGKKIGGDVLNNKKTILYILASQKAESNLKKKLDEFYDSKNFEESEKIDAVKGIYDHLKINDQMVALQNSYFEKATSAVNSTSLDKMYKDQFIALAKDLLDRKH